MNGLDSCRYTFEVPLQGTIHSLPTTRGSAPGYDEDALRASSGTVLPHHEDQAKA